MSSVPRSINILLRSSRASLLRPRAVNPIHHVWSNEQLAARAFATHFERTKPHVNIGTTSIGFIYSIGLLTASKGTIGHVDHGKVTALAQIFC